jgi:alpha-galactosidase
MRVAFPHRSRHTRTCHETAYKSRFLHYIGATALMIATTLSFQLPTHAQVNGVGQKPYLGWSTYSQQTIVPTSTVMTQANILAQSDALKSSGLQAHGFNYINLDGGWTGDADEYGRTLYNKTAFPDFFGMIAHIHANGQKFGIYMNPGISQAEVASNPPILGTQYHLQDIIVNPPTNGNAFGGSDKIDFTKPGAQEYMNSIINLYASWGVDFIKLDAVTPGSYSDDLTINNIPDVQALSKAIAQSGRPIWFTISWAINEDYLSDWQQYSNARRIEGDIECEGDCPYLTNWPRVGLRLLDLPGWENAAGPKLGWNDLDSLEIGNTATGGITATEQQTAMTIWAMANAPLFLGSDLTKLDSTGKQLLTNDEVLAVDQSGHPGKQITAGFNQVWASSLGNGSFYVALFNLNDVTSQVSVDWNALGFVNASQVRDLWTHTNLGPANGRFTTVLPGHGARLLRVSASGHAPQSVSLTFGAASATLTGSSTLSPCSACASGNKLTYLGLGPNNNATFNVPMEHAGNYRMQVDSITNGTRSYVINVNGGPDITLNSSGGSANLPSSITIPIHLEAGVNTIEFGNPASYPPDLDRIIVSGDGNDPLPTSTTYEGEYATLSGTASQAYCSYCSGLSKAGNLGGTSNATFTSVTVPAAGVYQMQIDYLTQGARSFFISVNGGTTTELDLNGFSFNSQASIVVPVKLTAGANTIQFGNPTNAAPDLDRIVIAPVLAGQPPAWSKSTPLIQ